MSVSAFTSDYMNNSPPSRAPQINYIYMTLSLIAAELFSVNYGVLKTNALKDDAGLSI
jgi:hypothetical protein